MTRKEKDRQQSTFIRLFRADSMCWYTTFRIPPTGTIIRSFLRKYFFVRQSFKVGQRNSSSKRVRLRTFQEQSSRILSRVIENARKKPTNKRVTSQVPCFDRRQRPPRGEAVSEGRPLRRIVVLEKFSLSSEKIGRDVQPMGYTSLPSPS